MHTYTHPTHLLNHLSFHTDELLPLGTDFEGWGDAADETLTFDQVFQSQTATDEKSAQNEMQKITTLKEDTSTM